MQQLEYTPSIYFDCTSNKHNNLSAEIHFQLSSTHQKYTYEPFETKPTPMIELTEKVRENPFIDIRTQEFFEEFQHNFIVTFDAEIHSSESMDNICKTGQFAKQGSVHQNGTTQKDIPQTWDDSLSKIDLSLLPQNSKQNRSPQTNKFMKQVTLMVNINEVHTDVSTVNPFKEKDSPIEFEVKKRTVFKNKENIMSNAQQFKITKKKIINQNTLQSLTVQAKSCKTAKTKINQSQKCIKSEYIGKGLKGDKGEKGLLIDINSSSNIFLQHKQARQSFRSTTLDNWKRKFQIKKKSLQKKTQRRINIFHNPFLHR